MVYKILVCGGRQYGRKWDYVNQRWSIDIAIVRRQYRFLINMCRTIGEDEYLIIHGAADGADSIAAGFVRYMNKYPDDCFKVFEDPWPADWKEHKRAAGPIRNRLMLTQNPKLVISMPGGVGTADMIRISKKAGVPVYEVK